MLKKKRGVMGTEWEGGGGDVGGGGGCGSGEKKKIH